MDVYALLVTHLSTVLGVGAVSVAFDHEAVERVVWNGSAAVFLESAGPARRGPAWQGLGVDVVGVDVNVVVSREADFDRQAGALIARRVRAALNDFREGAARAIEVSRPERWPDINQKTRRYGMTVEVAVPA